MFDTRPKLRSHPVTSLYIGYQFSPFLVQVWQVYPNIANLILDDGTPFEPSKSNISCATLALITSESEECERKENKKKDKFSLDYIYVPGSRKLVWIP